MSKFGRNDQAPTANSTTTTESSTGAPIGSWHLVKGSGRGVNPISMDSNSAFGNTSPGSAASVDVALFNNTTPGAFITNMAVGVYGVSATEMSNNTLNHAPDQPAHAGWVVRRAGTGPLINFGTSNAAALTGYNNTDYIVVSSPQAGGNAVVSFVTNATGGGLVFTINTAGAGFTSVNIATANIYVVNSTGGATATGNSTVTNFTATAGGRAGRVHTETLVAQGSVGAQTAAYGTPASVADSATDNTQYPGA